MSIFVSIPHTASNFAHYLFPSCMFNPHLGKYTLMMGNNESGEILKAAYDNEPKEDLRAIEVLYYDQKE